MRRGLRLIFLLPLALVPAYACGELIGLDEYRTGTATATGVGGHDPIDGGGGGGADGGSCEPWARVLTQMDRPSALLLADGVLYAAGQRSDGQGALVKVSPCDGSLQGSSVLTVADARATNPGALDRGGEALVVAGTADMGAGGGSADQAGLISQHDPGSLELLDASVVNVTAEPDELWDVTASADGRIWAAGTHTYNTNPTVWAISQEPGSSPCGWLPNPGYGRLAAFSAGALFLFTRAIGGNPFTMYRFQPDDCDGGEPCVCPYTFATDHVVGSVMTDPRALLVEGSSAYVGGFTSDTSLAFGAEGFVARIKLGSGTLEASTRWDPTLNGDSVSELASDGTNLFVAGFTNFVPNEFDATDVRLLRLPLDFADDEALTELSVVGDKKVYAVEGLAVEPEPDGAIFLLAMKAGSVLLLRCDKQGNCPVPP